MRCDGSGIQRGSLEPLGSGARWCAHGSFSGSRMNRGSGFDGASGETAFSAFGGRYRLRFPLVPNAAVYE